MSDWEDEPVMTDSAQGGSSGGSSRTCYKCKQEGHMSFECPESSGGGGGGGGGSRACYKCQEEGHMARDCPSAGDSDKKRGCFKCGEEGHMSRECPNNDGDDDKKKGCFKCGEEGHMSRECPTGGGSKGCFKCGEEGHMARDCTNPEKERSPEDNLDSDGNPRPPIYVPEHVPDEQLFNEGVHAGINFAAYEKIEVKVSGEGEWLPRIKEFEDSDLRDILKENIKKSGYTHPTPIQRNCIPIIMGGRDIMGCAQTGSGKTAAFMLPILDRLLKDGDCSTSMSMCAEPSALIVAPTRELAIQIHNEGRKFAINSVLRVVVVYGGASTGSQARTLQLGCSVLVATPGRLMDFIKKGKISLGKLKFLVLDEADRMLDMGFVGDIETLMNNPDMPDKSVRQSLMFSATFPTEIQQLAGKYLNNYVFCVVGMVGAANSDVTQEIISVEKTNKRQKLLEVMQDINSESSENKILIFVETKRTADFLASYLSTQKVNSTSIHGDRFQSQREEALAQFKLGVRSVLVATAVAARGLDIRGVTHVINYDLPKDVDEYVHRIGRTGRVGNRGKAISFFDESMDGTIAKSLVQKLNEAQVSVPDFLENSAAGGFDGGAFASEDIRGEGTSAAFGGPLPADDDEEW